MEPLHVIIEEWMEGENFEIWARWTGQYVIQGLQWVRPNDPQPRGYLLVYPDGKVEIYVDPAYEGSRDGVFKPLASVNAANPEFFKLLKQHMEECDAQKQQ